MDEKRRWVPGKAGVLKDWGHRSRVQNEHWAVTLFHGQPGQDGVCETALISGSAERRL